MGVELHGTLHQLCCSDSNCHYTFAAWSKEELLQCPVCGSLLRPNVVWFGEALSPNVLETAVHSSQHGEFFFSIGTSGVVEPAASLPYEALRAGAWLVEINPQSTPLTVHAHYYFPHPAGQILPLLVNTVWPS